MRVLAFVNQKGGCGKTTTAVHLAAALSMKGQRVLLVDLDPQAHATLSLGVDVGDEPSMIEVLSDEETLDRVTVAVPGGFHLAPASESLAEFEEFAERMVYPERVLASALDECADLYDFALLDCPPRADGVLTANALRASDTAILVVECGAFALQGALRARRILERVAENAGKTLHVRVVATLFDRRTRFSRELLIGMQARFGPEMFDAAIRTSVRLREAVAHGCPVQLLEPEGKATEDFAALAEGVLAMDGSRVVEAVPFERKVVPQGPRAAAPSPTTGERQWTP